MLAKEVVNCLEPSPLGTGGALRMAKRLLREGERATLESLLEISASYQAIAHMEPDHHEAVRAFVEKRAPRFS